MERYALKKEVLHSEHSFGVNVMGVADLMKELRLLKGQQGYRYCMAWLVVLTHLLTRPMLALPFLFVVQKVNDDTPIAKAISGLVSIFVRAVGQYLSSI